MIYLSCFALALLIAPQLRAETNLTIYPESAIEYTVLNGPAIYFEVDQAQWGPGWSYFTFGGSVIITNGGRRVFEQTRTINGTANLVTLHHEAWQSAPNQVVLEYSFYAPQDSDLTKLCATIQTRDTTFAGGVAMAISPAAETNTLNLPFDGPSTIGASVKRLILQTPTGTNTIVDIDPPRLVSEHNQARIEFESGSITGGTTNTTRLTITFPEDIDWFASEEESWIRSDTNDWFAYEMGPEGVPIDLSFLSKDTAGNYIQAGAHGFLTVTNDEFMFEDGTPVRFWGLNLTAGAALGGDTRAEDLAERLARLGINVVRLHHLDSWYNAIVDYGHPDGTTQHLDENHMQALDKTIFELKKHGIYVVLDPWVQRYFTAVDGVDDYGHYNERGNFNLHPYVYLDARMQELIKLTWTQVWSHTNIYTGVEYRDEPAIAMTEVINEGLMQRGANHIKLEPWKSAFTNWYESWASENGGTPDLGDQIISQNYGENNLSFYVHVHRHFYTNMLNHFRQIGVRVPVNASNWALWPWEIVPQTVGDFMDGHHYYGGDQIGPGSGLGGLWLEHPPNVPATPFAKIAGFAVHGKPVASSECGNNPPKTYRSAYPIGLAAVAAFQGWDSITGYAYSQSTGARDELGAYEWESDPATLASIAAGALIYRRQDVSAAQETIAFTFPGDELWTLHWQDGGVRDFRATMGFNVAIEQHKVQVVLDDELPAGLNPDTSMTTTAAYDYVHPNTEITSDTGQLWRDWGLGIGKIDTPRTQAAYGRLGEVGRILSTSDCTFDIETPYAVVCLSSLTRASIAHSSRLLLIVAAHAENSGQAANRAMTRIADSGTDPIICEPVTGTVTVRLGSPIPVMRPILIDGSRGTPIKLATANGIATIELQAGPETLFYEIDAPQGFGTVVKVR